MKIDYELEFWADSFHEGNWACEELGSFFKIINIEYLKGFNPTSQNARWGFLNLGNKPMVIRISVEGIG